MIHSQLPAIHNVVDSLSLNAIVERTQAIAENTTSDFVHDDFNLIGVIALAVAAVALIMEIFTLRSQWKTESNTKQLSLHAQHKLMMDLYRHLYRNMVAIYTIKTKLEDIDYQGYPSEEHLLKMKIPMENINLKAFYGREEYANVHELFLKIRNYNIEIDVACAHLTNERVPREVKERDIATLVVKSGYLTNIIQKIVKLCGMSENSIQEVRDVLHKCQVDNVEDNKRVERNDNFTKYGTELKDKYATEIYHDDATLYNAFIDSFNVDVSIERGNNEIGGAKIGVFKF